MIARAQVLGLEINPKLIGALFTEKIGDLLRIFCFYTNGDTSEFNLPAQENMEGLRELLSKLNVDETCSSIIVDEVVQGRVFIRRDDTHWLYTLLSAQGNILPPFNADICDLPWVSLWKSQEVEVLQYGKTGDKEHCFAIRTEITEGDAERLVKTSKAFTHPTMPIIKQPRRWLYLGIAAVLGVLGILVGLTFFYTQKIPEARAGSVTVAAGDVAPKTPVTGDYYLLCNRQISGPFPAKTIIAMRDGGLFSAETLCRPDGATEWMKLATLAPPPK